MSGGIGGANLVKLCDELIENTDIGYRIFAMTGRNESLKNEIDKRYKNSEHIQAVPFTKDINLYMNSADVLLTKPGGLSSTEAAVANVPMIHVNAIPGCENEKRFSLKTTACLTTPKIRVKLSDTHLSLPQTPVLPKE